MLRPIDRRRLLVPRPAALALSAPLVLALSGCGAAESDSPPLVPGPDDCPPGEVDCGSGCVDPYTDEANCGTCGHACLSGEQCHSGQCGAPCDDECGPSGTVECFEGGLRECGELDGTDLCLEWSEVEPCADGLVCDPTTLSCREACGDTCDPFSVVLLPDTQYYTQKQADDSNNTYYKQAQWIIDHQASENIQFVIHLGDVTDDNVASQWHIADTAHGMLDAADIPYSIVPGNHDYRTDAGFDRGGSLFDDYFGRDRFEGRPWYGGAYGGGNANTNNYTFFEVGLMKFMVLSLEYAPRKDVLCWAEEVIAQHPDHHVIIATHCYMTHSGAPSSGCPVDTYAILGASGQDVWNEIAQRHSNVFLVVSGHVTESAYRSDPGNLGNPVHQMVVDYQMEAACSASDPSTCTDHCRGGTYTGNGWLRLLTFDPRANHVYAETLTVEEGNANVFPNGEPVLFCSPLYEPVSGDTAPGGNWYSEDPLAADHVFDFAYDMTTPPDYGWDDAGRHGFADRAVNSVGSGDQLGARIAMSPTGSFVVAWEDDSSTADGAGNFDILARGFDPGGCESFADIVVNPETSGHQQSPAIAMDADGNFVVVWADDQDDNGAFQIHGRGFWADGTERIARFTVNSVADGQQLNPAIAMAPDGRFVVAWEDDPGAGVDPQIWVRGFASDGAERFGDQSVHSDSLGERIEPAVGMDEQGNFVVAWQDDTDANGTYQIHARGFFADGSERFPRVTVNAVADGQQRDPAMAMSPSGDFVVAWEDRRDSSGDYRIYARRFAAGGAAGNELVVSSDPDGVHLDPRVAITSDGAFAVAWADDSNANGSYQIRGRSYAPTGEDWLVERTLNRVADGQQLRPDLAMERDGTLVATWEDDMDSNGAYQIVAAGIATP